MAGHSKWANIKHRKGAQDAKRGKVWTKIIKEITVAARCGGGDPDANPRLRTAMDKGRGANMPNDNIDRAIKRGTGELEGVNYEEITYEGYGPSGVALLIQTMTDNGNRTVAEIRSILSKHGGNLGEAGSVAWMFDRRGIITLPKENITEEQIMEIAIEAGGEDIRDTEETWEVVTPPNDVAAVKAAITEAGLKDGVAEVRMEPQNTIKLDDQKAISMLKIMELLEDHDDIQEVSANFDIADEVFEQFAAL